MQLREVASDARLPKAVDVVVIGGGIVGASAAWHLAKRGLSVALCEKGVIGGEQSGRNWGWCRNTLRHPAEIPLMQQSMRDWRDLAVFGALDTGFRTSGILYSSGRNRNDEASYDAWLASVARYGLDSRMVTAAEVAGLVPGGAGAAVGGLYTASDGGAEPDRATAVIAEAARNLGASLHAECAVRSLELQGGELSGVVTEQGRIECRAVLLAAGVWSRLFAGNLGIDLPQLKVMGSVMRTHPLPGGPDVSVAGRRFGWRKRRDGGYTVSQADATIFDIVPDSFRLLSDFRPAFATGLRSLRLRIGRRFVEEARLARRWQADEITPFEQVRIADPEPAERVLQEAVRAISAAYPVFAGMRIAGQWGGLIDVMPDALPVIGPVLSIPGLFMATGFSGHGFGIGPGAGRLAAELIHGDAPCVDPEAFRLERFRRAQSGSPRAYGTSG
ncbi:FAD-binding oxidoreductase [Kaistia sp. 32K]|uniref:NAD(P)/FAD-dependent oxidoreductase n=1 Tax=Kaistia sp. 32K TaxID=2795690 RepID=UPI0019153FDF|nr:FAD-binding oxidoreductase [Kaistia sp. 32K]